MINDEILREYDIRGIYGSSLKKNDIVSIADSISSIIIDNKIPEIIIGHDGRDSSLEIKNLLVSSINNNGVNVIDISLVPTPLCYYATNKIKIPNSIMITGSHNPQEYNGFKFIINNEPFYGKQIKNLNNIQIKDNPKKIGLLKHVNIVSTYVNEISNKLNIKKDLKIAWDIGNGVVGSMFHSILKAIPGNHIVINSSVDGNFPNHHPDPTVLKNNIQISKLVQEQNCDLGISFDGDGDRLGIIDNKGQFVYSDIVLLLISKFMSLTIKDLTVVADVKCSQILFDNLKTNNINILMSKTGHSLIKKKIKETNAHIAGEMSGHIFFNHDYYGFDDAIFAAFKFLEYLTAQDKKLNDIVNDYLIYSSSPEIKLYCNENVKFKNIDSIINKIKENSQNLILNELDGIRVESKDFWYLIRASNTQNCLVFRLECKKNLNFKEEINNIQKFLQDFDLDLSELNSFYETI
ncbi:MAG: phosphomannomutase/phosphoglucomutase [Alphaproteobacteria bacterium]|jgi:phosphomannomutase|nr:phosphomannomutase/phosphoglucomutase [Alphaproteobacteria bacterium]